MTFTATPAKTVLWDKEFIIDNLPIWIYTDNEQPRSISDCKAKISATQYTIKDIDLQIEIRELELKTGNSRHSNAFDYEKWKAQALRAKQTHLYLLNAYTYWLLLSEKNPAALTLDKKLNTLITLLIEDPADFVEQIEKLL